MASQHGRSVRFLLRQLRQRVPTVFPVRLRWVDACEDNCTAMCYFFQPRWKRPFFQIELSRARLPEGCQWRFVWETVVHEYAHALVWTEASPNLNDHGPIWGVAYAEVYRVAERFM